MKKLFAMAAFAAAMIFGACTETKTSEEALDFEKATPESVVNTLADKVKAGDATAITAAITTVQEQLNKLASEGNVEKFSEYATKIQAFVEDNAEALKNLNIDVTPLATVLEQVKAVPGSAEDAATDALDDAKDALDEAQDAVEGAVDDAVGAAQDAAQDAADAAQDAANKAAQAGKAAVDEGKAKAREALQNAADQLQPN